MSLWVIQGDRVQETDPPDLKIDRTSPPNIAWAIMRRPSLEFLIINGTSPLAEKIFHFLWNTKVSTLRLNSDTLGTPLQDTHTDSAADVGRRVISKPLFLFKFPRDLEGPHVEKESTTATCVKIEILLTVLHVLFKQTWKDFIKPVQHIARLHGHRVRTTCANNKELYICNLWNNF
jgi:hypothetical protein